MQQERGEEMRRGSERMYGVEMGRGEMARTYREEIRQGNEEKRGEERRYSRREECWTGWSPPRQAVSQMGAPSSLSSGDEGRAPPPAMI